MSTLLILVVVGLSIVAVTVAVVAEPDKPATERRRNLRDRLPRQVAVAASAPAAPEPPRPAATAPAPAPAAPRPVEDAPPARVARGELYRPPRWWQRLRSIVLLVILTALVGATVAAVFGGLLALIGIAVREAVS